MKTTVLNRFQVRGRRHDPDQIVPLCQRCMVYAQCLNRLLYQRLCTANMVPSTNRMVWLRGRLTGRASILHIVYSLAAVLLCLFMFFLNVYLLVPRLMIDFSDTTEKASGFWRLFIVFSCCLTYMRGVRCHNLTVTCVFSVYFAIAMLSVPCICGPTSPVPFLFRL